MMMMMVIVIMIRERQTLLTDCLTWGTSTGDGSAGPGEGGQRVRGSHAAPYDIKTLHYLT
jgi:hypothetical protein